MVLIAKWLLEHDPEARILVVTDRDELEQQIEGVMRNAGLIGEDAPSPRITLRAELVQKLGAATPRLLCALIHKFDPADLNGPPPRVQGRFYSLLVAGCRGAPRTLRRLSNQQPATSSTHNFKLETLLGS